MSILIKGMKMPKEGEYRMTLYVCDGGYAYMDVDSFPVDEDRFDAVPVVRCKECKHWGMHKSLNVPWCFEMHIDKSEEGYCDSGERRANE